MTAAETLQRRITELTSLEALLPYLVDVTECMPQDLNYIDAPSRYVRATYRLREPFTLLKVLTRRAGLLPIFHDRYGSTNVIQPARRRTEELAATVQAAMDEWNSSTGIDWTTADGVTCRRTAQGWLTQPIQKRRIGVLLLHLMSPAIRIVGYASVVGYLCEMVIDIERDTAEIPQEIRDHPWTFCAKGICHPDDSCYASEL
jgi:hypothetical protein